MKIKHQNVMKAAAVAAAAACIVGGSVSAVAAPASLSGGGCSSGTPKGSQSRSGSDWKLQACDKAVGNESYSTGTITTLGSDRGPSCYTELLLLKNGKVFNTGAHASCAKGNPKYSLNYLAPSGQYKTEIRVYIDGSNDSFYWYLQSPTLTAS